MKEMLPTGMVRVATCSKPASMYRKRVGSNQFAISA